MMRAFLLIVLGVCLFGCTMIPAYNRPAPPVPAEWPTTGPAYKAIPDEGDRPAADIGWREFYLDERVQKVIDLALANNRDLRIAASNIERARGLYRIQRSALFPTVNATGGLTEQQIPAGVSQTGESYNSRQYFADVGTTAWEIDFFGRIRSLNESALQQYFATEQARRSTQISLVAEVANAYLARAADSESLKLAQSTLEARVATYNLVRHRFQAGVSSALDLRQSETVLESARTEVARFTRLVALDENALNLLVGSAVPTELLANELSTIKPPRDISISLSSSVLLNRPDILQAEDLLKSANASIGAARAAFFPRVTLTTSIGTISPDLSNLFKAGSGTWLFAPQIDLPIFDAGSRRANLQVAKADRDIFLARYEKAIQIAFREVSDALAYRGTLGDQITAQEAVVVASDDTYRLSEARYTKGIDSYLAVLDAQRSLYVAQQQLINLYTARLNYLVTLYKVLGGGA
ncbi:MAG: Outer membrane protein OprM precursor [Syntrophorhabdaceae bacterium PtaU1.Bin034]|nr:MAG: Outer membrane protein OprM precursor [Syntrophorhabdaceae bacterium PtaU1.Bin034]